MGTNAIIVKKNANGEFEGIRLNYDGYIEHAGRILHNHYNNEDKIDVLLKQGDLSILETEPNKCVAYNRDSASKEQNAQTFVRLSDFGSVPYIYLWKNETWFVSIESDDFSLLTNIL